MTSSMLGDEFYGLDDDDGFTGEVHDLGEDELLGEDPEYGEAAVVRDHRRAGRRSPAQQAAARRVSARHQLATIRRRQREASVRDRWPVRVEDAVRSTQTAVREVDLRGRVQTDEIGSALRAQSRRADGTERALGAKIAEERLRSAFGTHPLLNNALAETVVPLTPLLFLRPARGPIWQDVRFVVPAVVAGITLGKELLGRGDKVDAIRFTVSNATKAGQTVVIKAAAIDTRGRVIPGVEPQITATNMTSDPSVPGKFTLGTKGEALITATADGISDVYVINVE